MPEIVSNAISNCVCTLSHELENADESLYDCVQMVPYYDLSYHKLNAAFWTLFLNKRYSDLQYRDEAILNYLSSPSTRWYKKIDCVEFIIEYMAQKFNDSHYNCAKQNFIVNINESFERLNFGYRVIEGNCVEITSNEEITAITRALSTEGSVSVHLKKAIELFSKRPVPDYRNSIKESISAVEAYCREQAGTTTLGPALAQLKAEGKIHPMLKTAFENLYSYTNQKNTGIRHALMDESNAYKPSYDEAYYMLISCSAFVNYLRLKAGEV